MAHTPPAQVASRRAGASLFRFVWVVPLAAAVYLSVNVAVEPHVGPVIERIATEYANGIRQAPEFADYTPSALFGPSMPSYTPDMEEWRHWMYRGVESLLMVSGLAVLACGIAGGLFRRWMLLTLFLLLVHAVNTAVESTFFIETFSGPLHLVLGLLPAALLSSLVLAIGLWPASGLGNGLKSAGEGRPVVGRLLIVWAGFIFAYWVGGMILSTQMPLLRETYNNPDNPVTIPPPEVILAVQCVRSLIFLIPTVAVIERWAGGRVSLLLALFWAHWTLVGLAPLVTPNTLFPLELQIGHILEIGFDSLLYAAIAVLALAAPRRSAREPRTAAGRASAPASITPSQRIQRPI